MHSSCNCASCLIAKIRIDLREMYGVKQLQFDSSYPDPACDACNNKHLSLFSLGEYCKVYDNKTCCFSELAKDQIHLCKECIFALRKTKVFQTRCFNAQKVMEAHYNMMVPIYQQQQRYAPPIQQLTLNPPPEDTTRRDSTAQSTSEQTERPENTNVPLVCGCVRRT